MDTLSCVIMVAALLGADEPTGTVAAPTAGRIHKIAIVYSINNFGNTVPVGCKFKVLHNGGLPRRMTLLKELAAAGRPLLVVDGGATFFPDIDKPKDDDRPDLFLKAELISEAMSRMGYHAMTVGTSDLLLGLGELVHMSERSKFPILCANLTTPRGRPFEPFTVVEVDGLKIGVIGLLLETMGRVYMEKVAGDAKVIPAIDATREVLKELRDRVDMVVVLSHNRMDKNRDLAREVEGIDVILDPSIEYASHHSRVSGDSWEELVGGTLIARGDGNGSAVGFLEIDFKKKGAGMGSRLRLEELEAKETEGTLEAEEKIELEDLRGRNIYHIRDLPLSPHYADDLEGLALIDANRIGGDVSQVASLPPASARGEYLTASACKDCHVKQHDFWASTKHYRAFDVIRKLGEDKRPECISCHTTGYGLAFVKPSEAETFNGVQCESCHGTSPGHIENPTAHTFTPIAEKTTCLPCHNEDVLKKSFSFTREISKVACPAD